MSVVYSECSKWGNRVYEGWFAMHKRIVDACRSSSPAVGVIWAMIMLEVHTIIRVCWHTLFNYGENPEHYGFNPKSLPLSAKRPVLLIHGAAGSWNYLGDLARAVQEAGRPVFVINTGVGGATEEKRKRVYEKIEEIAKGSSDHKVDIVAHSMGGNLALYSAFSEACSKIDATGNLVFSKEKQANPLIGKVITLALPTDQAELAWVQEIRKVQDLFNITAKYDGLMGHKHSAVAAERSYEINAGHVGIVFEKEAQRAVCDFLN